MSSSSGIYNLRSNGSTHGDVFTRREVVAYMLDSVGYTPENNLSRISILEPSCGNGEFIVEILNRLEDSSLRFGFDFNLAFRQFVLAYEIDSQKVDECIQRVKANFPSLQGIENRIVCADFLLANGTPVDVVVGNPPYIRYEEIPLNKRELYKSIFYTFHFRTDIYVLFFEKSIRMLKPNGRHCFICANRWIKNQYGKKLRSLIANGLRICRIINMEHADAFHEEVLAYPAITLLEKTPPKGRFEYASADSIAELQDIHFPTLNAPSDDDWDNVFSDYGNIDNLTSIERQGFKIGIGVATGADSLFVSPSLPDIVEMELLLPVLNAKKLTGDTFAWDGRYLLNPYNEDGGLVRLDDFPMAKAYLEKNYDKLAKRHKATKNPSKWYATIDPIRRSLLSEPKILLPDISGNRFLFVDKGQFYPQHNLYYITGKNERSLKMLAALLMSDFIKSQLHNLSNHMNGGYARWQSQYLRKLRIPQLSALPDRLASDLLAAYDNRDYASINQIVDRIVTDSSCPLASRNNRVIPKQLSISFDFS